MATSTDICQSNYLGAMDFQFCMATFRTITESIIYSIKSMSLTLLYPVLFVLPILKLIIQMDF